MKRRAFLAGILSTVAAPFLPKEPEVNYRHLTTEITMYGSAAGGGKTPHYAGGMASGRTEMFNLDALRRAKALLDSKEVPEPYMMIDRNGELVS